MGHRACYLPRMVCKVGFVVYENVGLLDVVGPSDVFATANQLAESALYESSVLSVGRDYVVAESGLRLGVDADLSKLPPGLDTLIVAGGLGFREAMLDERLLKSISNAVAKVDRVASVCTGAFLLAAIGLLDNGRATTHWAFAAELAEQFPTVSVVSDEIYVIEGRVTTAAGVAAGIDLALAIVEADHGVALARSVSRRMVIYLHRAGGQSQFSERFTMPPSDRLVADEPISLNAVLADVVSEPRADWSVEHLAAAAAMSRRHFARVFRDRTGTTPARWVERVRVDAARELLDQGDLPVAAVAEEVGFRSVQTMRQAFQRVMGLAPTQYRAMHPTSAKQRTGGTV